MLLFVSLLLLAKITPKYVYLLFLSIHWSFQFLNHFLFFLESKNKFTWFCTKFWIKLANFLASKCKSTDTAQKMKFSIKDLFCKYYKICRELRILSHLLKKSLMGNFIFCAVSVWNASNFAVLLVHLFQDLNIFVDSKKNRKWFKNCKNQRVLKKHMVVFANKS